MGGWEASGELRARGRAAWDGAHELHPDGGGGGHGGDAAAERRQAVGHHVPPQRAPHPQLARGGVRRRRQVRSALACIYPFISSSRWLAMRLIW